MSSQFAGTDQTGTTADKRTTLDRFSDLPVEGVESNRATVRFSENIAIVSGEETLISTAARDKLLFTRTYVWAAEQWRLLSNTQFRDPR